MRLLLVVRGSASSPAARVRALQFVPGLARLGVKTRTLVWRATSRAALAADAARLLASAGWADVVVLQRPNQPRMVLDGLARRNPHLLVDFDDALWVTSTGEPSGAYGERLAHAVGLAKHVTPGSEYLAEWVREQSPETPVSVLRPSVDLDRWPRHRPGTHSLPRLGWIGTPGNLKDFGPSALAAVRHVLASDAATVRLISSGAPALEGVPAEVHSWSVEDEGRSVSSLDIGLMPLVDDERSRGRCGYKAIQYLASGVPVVASPVGAATEIVSHRRTGLLASSSAEWRSALAELVADEGRRHAMGAAGRRWVEREASLAVSLQRLFRVLGEVAR